MPLASARRSIVAAVTRLAKDDAYESWLQTQEAKVLTATVCAADDVPAATPIELESYLPFLELAR